HLKPVDRKQIHKARATASTNDSSSPLNISALYVYYPGLHVFAAIQFGMKVLSLLLCLLELDSVLGLISSDYCPNFWMISKGQDNVTINRKNEYTQINFDQYWPQPHFKMGCSYCRNTTCFIAEQPDKQKPDGSISLIASCKKFDNLPPEKYIVSYLDCAQIGKDEDRNKNYTIFIYLPKYGVPDDLVVDCLDENILSFLPADANLVNSSFICPVSDGSASQFKHNDRAKRDHELYRSRCTDMVNLVADYLDNIGQRTVFPTIKPGYLRPLVPDQAPQQPEAWEDILNDVERVVMPGITHWHHPRFHAYFPSANSHPALCGDILSGGLGIIGFTWASSPACTELEVVVLDWLAKMLHLPSEFMSGGNGGGVIQGTASEWTLMALFGARNKALAEKDALNSPEKYQIMSKLVGYYSDQAHCSVERAGLISMIRMRPIRTDQDHVMTRDNLESAIKQDIIDGFVPFFCVVTLGTTGSCAFDQLEEIGPVCEQYNIWLHVDAAYAGSAFICEEFRPLMKGIEHAMSFSFNPHKWLLANMDCSVGWYKDVTHIVEAFTVEPTYLQHRYQGTMPDFR
ncbi:hypothetical protein Ciccas_012491, partial [Cichlidogyrus casuarinus]